MKQKNGFTLVEIVISMVVMSIVLYAVMAIFITSGVKGVNVDIFAVAQSVAEGKMEETLTQSFSTLASQTATSLPGDLSAYSYSVSVNYVTSEALDTIVGYATPYKRVEISILHPKLSGAVTLKAIKTQH